MSMAIAAMVAWVVTASIGVYMLRTWVTRGGLRSSAFAYAGEPRAQVGDEAAQVRGVGPEVVARAIGAGLEQLHRRAGSRTVELAPARHPR